MDIKVTIVGCGAVVHSLYKRPLKKLERQGDLTVVGLVDPNLNRANELKPLFRNATAYSSIDAAFSACDSNLTIVASPPAFHAEHSILSLKHGNHVLCEKPMAATTAECNRMLEAARSSGLHLAIGMTRRFYPSFAHLKDLISTGELGEILSFSYREGSVYSWPAATILNFSREKGGGGVLIDIGSHVLDTIIWLLGSCSITSYCDDAIGNGVEANCVIHVESERGKGTIGLSWDQNLANELRVIGTVAEAVVQLDELSNLVLKKSGAYQRPASHITFPITTSNKNPKAGIPKSYLECIHFQLVQIIRSIRLGESIPATGEEGQEVISLINRCYEIAEPIEMTWLPPLQNRIHKRLHWRNH